MKKLLILMLSVAPFLATAQFKSFRFAFVSDTHINAANGTPEEDLRL